MVNLQIIELKSGEVNEVMTDTNEICIVILSGKCSIDIDHGCYLWSGLGNRNNVFEGTPDSVYVSRDTDVSIVSESDNFRAAIVSTEASTQYAPFAI